MHKQTGVRSVLSLEKMNERKKERKRRRFSPYTLPHPPPPRLPSQGFSLSISRDRSIIMDEYRDVKIDGDGELGLDQHMAASKYMRIYIQHTCMCRYILTDRRRDT